MRSELQEEEAGCITPKLGSEREGSGLRKEAASDLTCPGPPRMPLLLTDSTSCERSILRSSTAGEGRESVGTHSGRGQLRPRLTPCFSGQ